MKGTFLLQIPRDTCDPLVIAEYVLADIKILMSLLQFVKCSTHAQNDNEDCINATIIADPLEDVSQLPTALVNLLGNTDKIKSALSYARFMKSKDTIYEKMFAWMKNTQTLYTMNKTFLQQGSPLQPTLKL
ncbi:hypothetical protein HDU78_011683, partial [Chytriomyces hyalinus]